MIDLQPLPLIRILIQHMLEEVVVALEHREFHLHRPREADLLIHQRTLRLHIIVDRRPQRIERRRIAHILEIKQKILAPAELRIHPDPVRLYKRAPVQLIPQHPIVVVRRVLHHEANERFTPDHLVRVDIPLPRHHLSDDTIEIRDHHVAARLLGRPHHQLRRIRRQPVITVHELQKRTPRPRDRLVSRIRHPRILLMHDHHARIRPRISVADLPGPILTSIIHEDQLEIPKLLIQNTVHTARETLLRVIHRHDDTDLRLHRHLHQKTTSSCTIKPSR